MEKGCDSVLPYLGLQGFPDHPGPQGSSGRETHFPSLSESPAIRAPTLRPKTISREMPYRAVPMESRRSQSSREPPDPDDLRNEVMHIEEELSKKRHSRVGCLFMCMFTPLTHYTPRCQVYTGNQRPWNPHNGALDFRALEILSTNTFDYIPMAVHK